MLVFKISKWEYCRMSSTEMAIIFSMWIKYDHEDTKRKRSIKYFTSCFIHNKDLVKGNL